MRGSSSDQPRSSDDPMYQSPDPAPRSQRTPGGDRPPAYQSEERYWTDYLRIALPIAGLLLLLSVFWYWASSFIGDDSNGTQTPVVAVNVTPESQVSPTPTLQEAIVLSTPTTGIEQPTQAPTQAPAQPTQAPAEPTQAPAEPTQAPAGQFAEGDFVIVNDNDVNMRAEPSTAAEIVDTLSQGAELRILSSTPTEFTDSAGNTYTFWNVSDDTLGIEGWVAGQFLEK